ncbi:unnamed protein product [Polarella glacialis]|uniref:Uncharacterized protein n=1 Tax=Polarella glacialis TaxID=89957 RepID=A0A813DEP2_POLGL|nr:unnamed protein product [Polarella glacialis]
MALLNYLYLPVLHFAQTKRRYSGTAKDEAELEAEESDDGEDEDEEDDADVEEGEAEAEVEAEEGEAEVEAAEVSATSKPLAEAAGGLPSSVSASSPMSVLLVTRLGFGKRVRVSELRVRKRNQKGQKAIRLEVTDSVTAVCVTLSDELPRLPRRARDPAVLYQEQLVSELTLRSPGAELPALPPAEEAFARLKEEKRAPFIERHAKELAAYQAAVEARQASGVTLRAKLGQVLICTSGGAVSRVQVASVDVCKRGQKGRVLMKVPHSDEVCSASLLSSVDAEQDEGLEEPAEAEPEADDAEVEADED